MTIPMISLASRDGGHILVNANRIVWAHKFDGELTRIQLDNDDAVYTTDDTHTIAELIQACEEDVELQSARTVSQL